MEKKVWKENRERSVTWVTRQKMQTRFTWSQCTLLDQKEQDRMKCGGGGVSSAHPSIVCATSLHMRFTACSLIRPASPCTTPVETALMNQFAKPHINQFPEPHVNQSPRPDVNKFAQPLPQTARGISGLHHTRVARHKGFESLSNPSTKLIPTQSLPAPPRRDSFQAIRRYPSTLIHTHPPKSWTVSVDADAACE